MNSGRWSRGETVQHHRYTPGVRNAHGAIVPGFADPVDVEHVAVAPGSSTEPADGANQRVITQWSILVPPGVVVAAQDEFTVRERRFVVDGDPSGDWIHNRSRRNRGAQIFLKVVTG